MVDIRVQVDPLDRPEVILDKVLIPKLERFSFDNERFAEGLSFAGVQDQAIESLRVRFKHSSGLRLFSSYDTDLHELELRVGEGNYTNAVNQNFPGDEVHTLSSTANYALARGARQISDVLSRHPSTLANRRLNPGNPIARVGVLGLSTTVGAITGAQIAESTGVVPAGVGAIGGAVSAVIGNFGVTSLREHQNPHKQEVADAYYERVLRADDFANSDEAKKLFDGIVEVRLL